MSEPDSDAVTEALHPFGPGPDVRVVMSVDDVRELVGGLVACLLVPWRRVAIVPRLPRDQRQHAPAGDLVDLPAIELVKRPPLSELVHRWLPIDRTSELIESGEVVRTGVRHDPDELPSRGREDLRRRAGVPGRRGRLAGPGGGSDVVDDNSRQSRSEDECI